MVLASSSRPSFLSVRNSWTSLRWSPWSWITSPISLSTTMVPLQAASRQLDRKLLQTTNKDCTYRISSWWLSGSSSDRISLEDLAQSSTSYDHCALFRSVSSCVLWDAAHSQLRQISSQGNKSWMWTHVGYGYGCSSGTALSLLYLHRLRRKGLWQTLAIESPINIVR